MDSVLSEVLEAWIVLVTLTLARLTAFILTFPLFRSANLPRLVKVALAVLLTITWFFNATDMPLINLETGDAWIALGIRVARESFVGGLMGYGLGLFLLPAQMAGAYIAQEMGLSMATLANPSTGETNSVVGELFVAISMIIFFVADAHLLMFAALVNSLNRFPVGGGFATDKLVLLFKGFSESQAWGLQVAAPIGGILFLLTVVLATVMRVNPQFNLFTFGTAIRVVGGLLAMFVFVPETVTLMYRVFLHMQSILRQLGI